MITLAPWRWVEEPGGRSYWKAPMEVVRGCIDLRNETNAGSFGGSPQGFGIFRHDDPTFSDGFDIGEIGDSLRGGQRNSIRSLLGLSALDATSVRDAVAEILFLRADPKGETLHKPVRGRLGRECRIFLGGEVWSHRCERADDMAIQAALRVFQEDYRRHRAVVSSERDLAVLRRFTGWNCRALLRELSDDAAAFLLPAEHRGDGWLSPATTITDNFNRTDANPMSNSGEGWAWTELPAGTVDYHIATNVARQAENTNALHIARADSDLSGDDHYAQAVLVDKVTGAYKDVGIILRKDSSTTLTFYTAAGQPTLTPDRQYASRFVSGTETEIGSGVSSDYTTPDTLRLEFNGSAWDMKWGGSSIETGTDTTITGNLRCGLRHWRGGDSLGLDDFEAADLAVAVVDPRREKYMMGAGY